ncbi:hypothetical protein C8R47DRAFT_1212860 [Mycena vitilis]|nr:hypothetical protein C8R47DRAFT_1212860 [Mycena vitilis]
MSSRRTEPRAPVAAVQITATSPAAARAVHAVRGEETAETDAAQVLILEDRRDHRYDDRRDGDRRRRDERDRDYDQARSRPRKDGERESPRPRSPATHREPEKAPSERDEPRSDLGPPKRLNLDPDAPDEEGEEMDDEAGMMAMMGMSGFGTTKGKHIDGNQEGAVSVKKQRTWRQYMNRRGGFNRPLDKIK